MSSTSGAKPSLAIIDDYLNSSSTHFDHLQPQLSKISHYPDTINATKEPDALIARLKAYTIISCMRERTAFTREILSQLPNLKVLLTTGVRNASIDTQACEDHGIALAGTQGRRAAADKATQDALAASYDHVTEHCWALIMALSKRIPQEDLLVKQGGWQAKPSFSLAGKTLGLLGLGRLGSSTARTGVLGFGMKVVAWSQNLTQEKADEATEKKGLAKGTFEVVSKEELFRRADVLSVQSVLSERTRGIVGKEDLALMKKTAVLVNTSRGPLIDEKAVLECLEKGGIRGVGLDVFDEEPLPKDSKWRTTQWGEDGKSEVILSPHSGYVDEENMDYWYKEQAGNLERWLKGEELQNKITSQNTGYGK